MENMIVYEFRLYYFQRELMLQRVYLLCIEYQDCNHQKLRLSEILPSKFYADISSINICANIHEKIDTCYKMPDLHAGRERKFVLVKDKVIIACHSSDGLVC